MEPTISSREERTQRLRISRTGLAVGGSSVTVVLCLLASGAGYLPFAVVATYTVLVTLVCAVFYLLIRTGRNLRFADPSIFF